MLKSVFGKVPSIVLLALSLLSTALFTTLYGYEFVYTDLAIAHKLSKIESKLLVINFSSPSCYYCRLFEKEVLTNQSIQEFLRGNYIFVKIEPSNYKTSFLGKTYTNNELFSVFGVRGTPTFVFLKDNSIVTQIPGYMPANDYLKALKFLVRVVEEKYNDTFENYSKKNDPFQGKPKIVEISKSDNEFVLKNDKNAYNVDSVPDKVDIYKVYVTTNQEIAKALNQKGVIRVLLVK
ncbi:MAG: thioredoxin family protein [Fervidobacterium sp.]